MPSDVTYSPKATRPVERTWKFSHAVFVTIEERFHGDITAAGGGAVRELPWARSAHEVRPLRNYAAPFEGIRRALPGRRIGAVDRTTEGSR